MQKKKNNQSINKEINGSVILIDSIYRIDEIYYSKVFLEKYYFIEDIEIYCSNYDVEYYGEECMNLFFRNS